MNQKRYLCGQYLDVCAQPAATKHDAANPSPPPPPEPECRGRTYFAACSTGPKK